MQHQYVSHYCERILYVDEGAVASIRDGIWPVFCNDPGGLCHRNDDFEPDRQSSVCRAHDSNRRFDRRDRRRRAVGLLPIWLSLSPRTIPARLLRDFGTGHFAAIRAGRCYENSSETSWYRGWDWRFCPKLSWSWVCANLWNPGGRHARSHDADGERDRWAGAGFGVRTQTARESDTRVVSGGPTTRVEAVAAGSWSSSKISSSRAQ